MNIFSKASLLRQVLSNDFFQLILISPQGKDLLSRKQLSQQNYIHLTKVKV